MRKSPRTEGYESPDFKTHPNAQRNECQRPKGEGHNISECGDKEAILKHPEEDEERFIKNGIRMTLNFTIVRVEDGG